MTQSTLDLHIDSQRLARSIEDMAKIGPGVAGGCNRQALTDEDKAGRDQFVAWAKEAGCSVTVDAMGNIFARRGGSDNIAAPVFAGSHLDTQASGGRFDGVYGVMAALEVVRTLAERRVKTKRPIEIGVWTNEEGCRFAPAMLGSGVVCGDYTIEFAYSRTDKEGRRFGDELERIGYRGILPASARPYFAMFEAHIEQGPVLEHEARTIGVVTGIQGAFWFDVTLTGQSCHAGPTPMPMRRDPVRAAAPILAQLYELAARRGPGGRVTIGDMRASPGAHNTVPERLVFPVDLRHPEAATLTGMVDEFRALVAREAAAHRVEYSIEQVWHMPATRFDERLVELVERCAERLGYPHLRMVSGAGHDSLHTAKFAPTAMIFVPCKEGLSHNEQEDARLEDLAAGANVLLHAVLEAADA
jgi:beta-ureidopropionase / N-carbamoyl-L-amino-acid hydrolase